MKMDLVAKLLHTGVLTHNAFEDLYRQAGGQGLAYRIHPNSLPYSP